jgi:hypothetical protein
MALLLACLSGCGSPKPASEAAFSDGEVDDMADEVLQQEERR